MLNKQGLGYVLFRNIAKIWFILVDTLIALAILNKRMTIG